MCIYIVGKRQQLGTFGRTRLVREVRVPTATRAGSNLHRVGPTQSGSINPAPSLIDIDTRFATQVGSHPIDIRLACVEKAEDGSYSATSNNFSGIRHSSAAWAEIESDRTEAGASRFSYSSSTHYANFSVPTTTNITPYNASTGAPASLVNLSGGALA